MDNPFRVNSQNFSINQVFYPFFFAKFLCLSLNPALVNLSLDRVILRNMSLSTILTGWVWGRASSGEGNRGI